MFEPSFLEIEIVLATVSLHEEFLKILFLIPHPYREHQSLVLLLKPFMQVKINID